MNDFSIYRNKTVLITGNTGFKGSWLSLMLLELGANVIGYALKPKSEINLYDIIDLDKKMKTYYNDIRDYESLKKCFNSEKPEIVFHLAAQPIVRDSYINPLYTYECNVMGTVNTLECIRNFECVKSFLNVTTDKVYRNNEWEWGYRENDILDGYDPYSNSKSCSELVTASYKRSFSGSINAAISTVRAGNVIGGGDFSADRIIPDCVRAAEKDEKIIVRNPNSVRPYQHVIEPLMVYLTITAEQYKNKIYAGCYNVGCEDNECITTGKLADIFCKLWGDNLEWTTQKTEGFHEANFLKLDCSKIKKTFNWRPVWTIDKAIEKTVKWYKTYLNKEEDMCEFTLSQILEFMNDKKVI